MEGAKEYAVSWLDWGANYIKDDPQDFLSKCKGDTLVKEHPQMHET